jgi:hypothetical protein
MAAKKPSRKGKSKRELPNVKQAKFLAAYAKTANISHAAKSAGINRDAHYLWLEDPDYERKFALAHTDACESLEAEARRRGAEGFNEPVVYQGELQFLPKFDPKTKTVMLDASGYPVRSNVPLTIRKFSDVLLIFLMKAAMPWKYRDNFKGEVKDLAAAAVRGADVFQELTDEELDTLEKLSRTAAERRRDRGGKAATGPEPDPTVLP